MYLYEGYEADVQPQNSNGATAKQTAKRLSVIEITSILSVALSASILIFHVWKTVHDDEQRKSPSLARRTE